MVRCIYKIINVVNNKFYVGSAIDFAKRKRMHLWRLRRGDHANRHLQAAWLKYGEQSFVFVVVQHIAEMVDVLEEENVWLRAHVGSKDCYNIAENATAFGTGKAGDKNPMWGRTFMHTDEARAKIAEAGKGRFVSEETRAKRSAATKGRKVSEEQKRQISQTLSGEGNFWYGKKRPEHGAKVSRRVRAIDASGNSTVFDSVTELREVLALKPPTVNRALKSGQAIKKGPQAGWRFEYVDTPAST
jgi:group I intron endonuclease